MKLSKTWFDGGATAALLAHGVASRAGAEDAGEAAKADLRHRTARGEVAGPSSRRGPAQGEGHDVYTTFADGPGRARAPASAEVGLSTHVTDVVNAIPVRRPARRDARRHSYGGMVITACRPRPNRIKRLVYLDAFVPEDGESVESIHGERGAWIKQMTQGSFIVPPWVKPDQPPPKDVPQSLKTFTEPLSLKNKAARQLPAVYILTVEAGRDAKSDDFAAQAERARKRGWTVLQLTADHNPQWSAPEALVEMLDKNR